MRVTTHLLLACVAMAAVLAPSAALAYYCEGEFIPTSGAWVDKSPVGTAVTAAAISDSNAREGMGMSLVDGGSLAPDTYVKFTTVEGPLNGAATAVIRIRTAPDAAFSASPAWERNFVLAFVDDPGTTTVARRGVGLAIRPDGATVTNTTGSQTYGGVIAGDNTSFVTWTIVGRSYGFFFDLYRDGVKVVDNAANGSSPESVYSPSAGIDALAVVASNSSAAGTGAWVIDYVGYKAGEDPGWAPVPEPASLLSLAGALAGFGGLALRRRKA